MQGKVNEVNAVVCREKGSEVPTVEVGTDSEHLMLGLKTLESKRPLDGLGEMEQ